MGLKHDATDDVITAVDNLDQFELRLIAILKAYKRGDLLRDVCMAREEALKLRDQVDEIVRMVSELADRQVWSQVRAVSPVTPAPVATSRG